jgi:16S rRNA G1207 methylase RsmC
VKKDDRIIDLGCGNGMLLVELVMMLDEMKDTN